MLLILLYIKHFIFSSLFYFISLLITFKLFIPIYNSNEIIITYAIHPFDLCSTYPNLWSFIKISYFVFFSFSNILISNLIFSKLTKIIQSTTNVSKLKNNNIKNNYKELNILIGENNLKEKIYIPESRFISKFFNNWYNRFWKNIFSNVSIYTSIIKF